MSLFDLLAQTAPPTAPPATAPAGSAPPPFFQQLMGIAPFILAFIFLMYFMNAGKRKADKQKRDMLASLKKGDRVETAGGIRGVVTNVEADEITVKVDETSNTKLRFARRAIIDVKGDEPKTETK